jgi:hypothetical protein
MPPKYIAYLLLTLVFIIIVVVVNKKEGFATKHDKAEAIFDWMGGSSNPKYVDYKEKFDDKSNIVEFEDVLKLKKSSNFTVASIKNVI